MDQYIEKVINKLSVKLEKIGFVRENIIMSDLVYVSFLSYNYFITVTYGAPEFELSLVIGRVGKDDRVGGPIGFNMGEFLLLNEFNDWKWNNEIPSRIKTREEKLELQINEYIRFIFAYKEILFGGSAIYHKLIDIREKMLVDEIIQYKRIDADKMWENKQYDKVLEIYETMFDRLNEIEKKRLNICRKKMC